MKSILSLALGALLALSGQPLRAEIPFSTGKAAEVPAEVAPEPQPAAPAEGNPSPPPAPEIAPIGAALVVNGAPISQFEIDQRVAFLTALQQQGDLRTLALQGLVSDRLQEVEAGRMGLAVTPDDIRAGMTEFAARAKLSVEAFLQAMAQEGVAPETFRDFVKAGLLWRLATREKFAGKVEVTEAEVDRAIGMGASAGEGRRVLLSELVIPANGARDAMALANRVRLAIRTEKDFAIMARQFSAATTAAQGGTLNWLDEDKLPPEVQGALAGLHPGEMTRVVPLQGGAALYFLRDEGAVAGTTGAGSSVVEYAVFPGGTGTLAAQVNGCDALYPAARGARATLARDTAPEAALPADLRATVAGLDTGEARVLPDGRLVMVCQRMRASGLPAAREAVRSDILNRKVSLLADAWLEELRFDAVIETP